jgi:hypothetical protein
MNTFTADASLQNSLLNLPGLTEIRDPGGKVLGYFSPASHETSQAYAAAAAHFDPEELHRRKQSGEKGRRTEEVLKRLGTQD